MRGTLKKYDEYYNKLLDYAKVCGISVFFKEMAEEEERTDLGEYLPTMRAINLNKELTQKEIIAVLLHELGHFEDHKINGENKRTEVAYDYLNRGISITAHQKRLIIQCEQAAWEYGESLAKKLKIKLGSWYDKEMMAGLANYYSLKVRK